MFCKPTSEEKEEEYFVLFILQKHQFFICTDAKQSRCKQLSTK